MTTTEHAPTNTMTFEPPAKISSRPPAERVKYLLDTIAMLRQLDADAEERRRATGDICSDLDAEAGEDGHNDDLELRVACVADIVSRIGELLAEVKAQVPTALAEFDDAEVAMLERRLAGRSRRPWLAVHSGGQ